MARLQSCPDTNHSELPKRLLSYFFCCLLECLQTLLSRSHQLIPPLLAVLSTTKSQEASHAKKNRNSLHLGSGIPGIDRRNHSDTRLPFVRTARLPSRIGLGRLAPGRGGGARQEGQCFC